MNDELNAQLHAHFETISETDTPAHEVNDLLARMDRRYRRQRFTLASAAIIGLVGMSIGGYFIGNANTPEPVAIAAPGSTAPDTTLATRSNAPMADFGREGFPTPSEYLFTREADGVTFRVRKSTLTAAAIPQVKEGSETPSDSTEVMTTEVTGSDSITGSAPDSAPAKSDPWNGRGKQPRACEADTNIEIGLSTNREISATSVLVPEDGEPFFAITSASGPESQFLVVIATGVKDTVSVSMPDGTTDAMEPTNGMAVFAAAVTDEELAAADQTKVTTADRTIDATLFDSIAVYSNDPGNPLVASSTKCGPTLPDPGEEQPANPEGARAAISQALSTVADAKLDTDARTAVVEEPNGVASALDQANANALSKELRPVITNLVFISPQEALFTFSAGGLGDFQGAAVNTDGTWKITRATVCSSIGMLGGSCDGDIPVPVPPVGDVTIQTAITEPAPAPDAPVGSR